MNNEWKVFTVMVELKNGTRSELQIEGFDRDMVQRILVDSFGSDLVNVEFLTEEIL